MAGKYLVKKELSDELILVRIVIPCEASGK
jgi:hypothetical protein